MKKAKSNTRTIKRAAKPKVVRDNVLGRRPSKSDPLGEQPGSLGQNAQSLRADMAHHG